MTWVGTTCDFTSDAEGAGRVSSLRDWDSEGVPFGTVGTGYAEKLLAVEKAVRSLTSKERSG